MRRIKRTAALLISGLLLLTGCASETPPAAPDMAGGYRQIDQETARQMMALDDGHVVVDVRRFDEFAGGHIPGAICIPNESIGALPPEELPNIRQTILIYCRSGRRSKEAAEKLARMGYTEIYEFGGIIDWTGEVAAGQTLALTVESNPTTGYSWTAAQEPELFDIRSCYTSEYRAEPASGAGGQQVFILTPKQPGTATVVFTYARPWEEGGVNPQFSCTFEVSDELAVTVVDDGAEQGKECGYTPTLKVYG